MLLAVRRLARPLCALALVALLMPVQPADCLGFALDSGDHMPCCSREAERGTSFDADCCNMRERVPSPDRLPTTVPAARRTTMDDGAPAVISSCAHMPTRSMAIRGSRSADPAPPTGPLYLRLSTLRR
jgi:hypothetical protein